MGQAYLRLFEKEIEIEELMYVSRNCVHISNYLNVTAFSIVKFLIVNIESHFVKLKLHLQNACFHSV